MKESNRTVVVLAWGLNIQKWYEVERYENLTIDKAAEAVKKAYADYDDPIVKVY